MLISGSDRAFNALLLSAICWKVHLIQRFTFMILALSALAPVARGQVVKYPAVAQGQPAQRATTCFQEFTLPANAVILATGAYSGRRIAYQIDQSGHAAGQIDVSVNYPGKPVVLMLGAYDPTIWNIKRSPSTRIVAVYAAGYHRQAIAGVDQNVPQLVSTYDNRGRCGYFYATADKLTELNPNARKVFGRAVDAFYPVDNAAVLIGEPLPPGMRMIGSATTAETYHDTSAPRAGQAGLDHAVQTGVLRKATAADGEAWFAMLDKNATLSNVPPIAGGSKPRKKRLSMFNAYVVLKPFAYPAGLYGGNSATFLIPKQVPRPTGNPGHSAVYDFNTLMCNGALCGE